MIDTAAFAEWLLGEIQSRHMSIREFGRYAGIPAATLTKLLATDEKGEGRVPSVGTLIKLSRATKTDLCTLVALLSPEDARISPDVTALATRIARLSPEGRAVVEDWLMGRFLKGSNECR